MTGSRFVNLQTLTMSTSKNCSKQVDKKWHLQERRTLLVRRLAAFRFNISLMHVAEIVVDQCCQVSPFIRWSSHAVNTSHQRCLQWTQRSANAHVLSVVTQQLQNNRRAYMTDLAFSPPSIGVRTTGDKRGLRIIKAVCGCRQGERAKRHTSYDIT